MGGSLNTFTESLHPSCATCRCEAEDALGERGDMQDEATPILDDAVYVGGGVPDSVKTKKLSSAVGHLNRAGVDGDVYVITVDKRIGASKTLGLDIEVREDGFLIIRDILSGLVEQWNRSNPSAQVSVGDRILEVNGAADVASVMTTCRSDSMLRMVLQRAAAVTRDVTLVPSAPASVIRSPGSFHSAALAPKAVTGTMGAMYTSSSFTHSPVVMQPSSITTKMPSGVSRPAGQMNRETSP